MIDKVTILTIFLINVARIMCDIATHIINGSSGYCRTPTKSIIEKLICMVIW